MSDCVNKSTVVIHATPGADWKSFSTWYSAQKWIPDCEATVQVTRNGECPFQLFQWAKRLGIPVTYDHEESPEDERDRNVINLSQDDIVIDAIRKGFVAGPDDAYPDAKDIDSIEPVVSVRKGCGRWIDKDGRCPFSHLERIVTEGMTPAERRVITLWRKMTPLYKAIS